jgi:diaminohydroxyphosphoribosylaminopyrimidine deaminase / 5-amino-6-(5-phosphoribosylamino)uracil reductase
LIHLALQLAQQALTLTSPNPRVGCVICSPDGTILGQGHTQKAGGPHAEVMALRDAQAQGHDVKGATAYVTLEPCSHHGRTGPCCDTLIQAGIGKVVASLPDPNPLVAGQGFARLRAAGIEVEVGAGAAESRELNIGFFSRMVRKRPWVRLKIAASLDGTTALHNGQSQWITGAAARADGHAWRARACAILTGSGTLLYDNPRLDVRMVATERQPHVVVVDSQLQTPVHAAVFDTARKVLIYTLRNDTHTIAALQAHGATVITQPAHATPPHSNINLTAMLQDLAQHEINELHVEAGHTLNGALLQAGLVDEILVYLAPTLLGTGAGMIRISPLTALTQATPLRFISSTSVGTDLRILARVVGQDDF